MPKGIHSSIDVRIARFKAKLAVCETRLQKREVKEAQLALKDSKDKAILKRLNDKIKALEAQNKTIPQSAV